MPTSHCLIDKNHALVATHRAVINIYLSMNLMDSWSLLATSQLFTSDQSRSISYRRQSCIDDLPSQKNDIHKRKVLDGWGNPYRDVDVQDPWEGRDLCRGVSEHGFEFIRVTAVFSYRLKRKYLINADQQDLGIQRTWAAAMPTGRQGDARAVRH